MGLKTIAAAAAAVLALSLVGCGNKDDNKKPAAASAADVSSAVRSDDDSNDNGKTIIGSTEESSSVVVTTAASTTFTGEPEYPDEASAYSHVVSTTGFVQVKSAEEFEKCLDKLDEIANSYGYALGFSFENVETGAQINYNSMKQFMTCSTIKVPYIKSILADGIDLDEKIIKDKNWVGDIVGEDYIASMDMGTEFTAKELIEAAVQRSDNTAYYLLEQHYGWNVFNNLQYQIGSNYYVGSDWIFTYATSADMLRSYVDIYEFGEENELGEWLTDLMTDTDLNEQIGKELSKKYKVSQKYGSEFNENVYNDCAIVYAQSPFVLCIMSDQPPETEQSSKVFIELAEVFDEINSLIYYG